jgi:hypothetical protein
MFSGTYAAKNDISLDSDQRTWMDFIEIVCMDTL